MPNPEDQDPKPASDSAAEPANPSKTFFRSSSRATRTSQKREGNHRLEATVVTLTADSILLDIGFKTEGILPLTALPPGETVKPGDKLLVRSKAAILKAIMKLLWAKFRAPLTGRRWSRHSMRRPPSWARSPAAIKGGLSVDVGVRAFMPASRSGVRDAAEMEKLVGQEIRCRITKLDVTEEDVVVDRRVIAEEEERATKERRYSEIQEGETVRGTVRSLADYGAFVDIGGVDGLLHVAEISWSRVNKPSDVLSVGQEIEARVLKVDPEKRRISLGMKQLLPHPWDAAAEKYKTGERVRGTVTRLMDFGAFVELEPGVEGLIHVSEMSWSKKVRKPSDAVKAGETVEAVILGVNVPERRISLGLKQALGDPWVEAAKNLTIGSVIEGPVVSITKFGAFVQIAEGVEGMIHVSEISAEKRINHPQDVLKVGQTVKAQVLDVDGAKRNVRLSIKQMVPSSLDEYIAEHKEGDTVTGRVMQVSGGMARVELGEGVQATCRMVEETPAKEEKPPQLNQRICLRSAPCFSRAGRAALRPQPPSPMLLRPDRFAASASASLIRRPRRLSWSWPTNNLGWSRK